MNMHVFSGPTLSRAEVESRAGFTWHPPAAQGDVFRLVESSHPPAIGIVDGYFAGAPSVLHKEILWAMGRGCQVFGAASMGALRAAELHTFGMRGIGEVFAGYRDGLIDDDDEVAVVHGPAELDFVSISTPMVNIRATLKKATAEGVISTATKAVVASAAKSTFYAERRWPTLLQAARDQAVPEVELADLQSWLQLGELNVKRDDAIAMLEAMTLCRERGVGASEIGYRFEWTQAWDDLVCESDRSTATGRDAQSESRLVLDELRLNPLEYRRLRERAALHWLVSRQAPRTPTDSSASTQRGHLTEFRRALGLYEHSDFHAFLASRALTEAILLDHLVTEKQTQSLLQRNRAAVEERMLAMVRLGERFDSLMARVAAKQAWYARSGSSSAEWLPPLPAVLLAWYFDDVLEEPIPEDLDGFLSGLGLPDRQAFYRLLEVEYSFRSSQRGSRDSKEE